MDSTKIAIVGGGAAGLCAAIHAARACGPRGRANSSRGRACGPTDVTVLESGPRPGKKLLTTGNGRCNLTNLHMDPSRFHGDRALAAAVLARFGLGDTLDFFQSLGLLTWADPEGRVYPRSGQASSVLDALRMEADALGVNLLCDCPVDSLRRADGGYLLTCGQRQLQARTVIIAAGGIAASANQAYGLAKALGHPAGTLFPAICPVPVRENAPRALKGVRVRAAVRVLADEVCLREAVGEVQFTENALSGICVFELSRLAGEWLKTGAAGGRPCRNFQISLNFLPDMEQNACFEHLLGQARRRPALPMEYLPAGLTHKRVGLQLLRAVYGGPLTDPVEKLSREALARLAGLLRDWRFTPAALASWDQAQVTAGGVSNVSRKPENALESLSSPGLFFAGEILDVDGDCGGYNLQWAWSSGALAGRAAAER